MLQYSRKLLQLGWEPVFCPSSIPSEYLFLCKRRKFGFNKRICTKLLIVYMYFQPNSCNTHADCEWAWGTFLRQWRKVPPAHAQRVYHIVFLNFWEVMAKDTHRGHLLLHISPPYCIIPTVTFTMWQSKTCVLSCKFISPICTFSLVHLLYHTYF